MRDPAAEIDAAGQTRAARSGWLTRSLPDAPRSDEWLGRHEREMLAALRGEKRRAEWRLGRWAAKAAVAAWLERPLDQVEIGAAADGAPEALVAGEAGGVSLSLSHRDGRALVLVGEPGLALGCDIEVAAPRSDAFLRRWLTSGEQVLVAEAGPAGRTQIANVLWAAREAAAKTRREGRRPGTRHAGVTLDGVASSKTGWRPLNLRWPDAAPTHGWWRAEPRWVMAVATDPAAPPPTAL